MLLRIVNSKIDFASNEMSRMMIMFIPLILIIQTSCKKMVEIPPPIGAITENTAYTIDAAAIGVVTGIYTSMVTTGSFTGNRSITLFGGLSADELTLYSGSSSLAHQSYYKNTLSALSPTANYGSEHWGPLYNYVFKCNAAISGLNSSSADALRPEIRRQLLGEVKFLRAFFYLNLVNLYGDIPLPLSTEHKLNTLLTRLPKSEVYEQIIADLKDAQEMLSNEYLKETLQSATFERVRPTKWAANALLARVYLYTGDWENAEIASESLISNTALFSLSSLNNAFLKASLGNKEAIWQLQPTTQNFNTQEARTFIINNSGPNGNNPVYLSNNLLNEFEAADQRALNGNWVKTVTIAGVTYRCPYKYKLNALDPSITSATGTLNMKEYLMVLRLAEQYLIRAEARAMQNNIAGAQSDLNEIRTRAGLGSTLADDKASLLAAILHERRVELFTEFGHRWFDLKRTGNIDAVMNIVTPMKSNGAPWMTYQQLYPLPVYDLGNAPNLVQNEGY